MTHLVVIKNGEEQIKQILSPGVRGNYETLAEMARLVRSDSKRESVRDFVFFRVVNYCDGHAFDCEIQGCFNFANRKIVYRRDAPGIERIADFWTTTRKKTGDCADKSIWLATALACVGNKPFFIALGQRPYVGNSDWSFDHVFVGLDVQKNNQLNVLLLDPTPESAELAREYGAGIKIRYNIF